MREAQPGLAEAENLVHPVGAADFHVELPGLGEQADAFLRAQWTLHADVHLPDRFQPDRLEGYLHPHARADKGPFLVVRFHDDVQQRVNVLLRPVEAAGQVVVVILGQVFGRPARFTEDRQLPDDPA